MGQDTRASGTTDAGTPPRVARAPRRLFRRRGAGHGSSGATEASRMGRNFSSVALAGVVTQLLTFVVSISLARYLGVTDYGLFAFGFSFPQWFTIILDLGLDSVVTIDVAADRSRASDYMTSVALIRILPLLAGLASLGVSLQFILADPTARLATFILGAAILLGTYTQLFSGVFRAFERMEYLGLLSVLAQAITTAGVLLLIFLGFGLVPISLVYLGVIFVYAAVALVVCRRHFAWFSRHVNRQVLSHILHTTGPFATDDVVSAFMFTGGPVLLTLLAGSAATGIFSVALAITTALRYPLNLYNTAALPAMSRFHGERNEKLGIALRRSQKLFFMLGAPATVGGWFYRDQILNLIYGAGYASAGISFGILVWVVAVSTATLGVGMTLAATGHQKLNMIYGIIGVAINLGLCVALIPLWGAVGAAVAFLAATTFTATACSVAVHRYVARMDLAGTLARPVVASAFMALVLVLIHPAFPLGIGVGALLYFAVLLLVRGVDREDLNLLRQVARGALFR